MKWQEEQIEETLNSINGIRRAQMPAGLPDRIMRRLEEAGPKIMAIPRRNMWLMAAGIALLAGLNFYTLLSSPTKQHIEMTADSGNPVATEYFTPMPTI
jgi:hypothetical protein